MFKEQIPSRYSSSLGQKGVQEPQRVSDLRGEDRGEGNEGGHVQERERLLPAAGRVERKHFSKAGLTAATLSAGPGCLLALPSAPPTSRISDTDSQGRKHWLAWDLKPHSSREGCGPHNCKGCLFSCIPMMVGRRREPPPQQTKDGTGDWTEQMSMEGLKGEADGAIP